jgi:serine phosphatase RsbU (regulator of sigma subunit)
VFGRDRLVAAVREAHLGERPLAEVGEAVIQRVKTFTGRRPHEDVCLLLARRV